MIESKIVPLHRGWDAGGACPEVSKGRWPCRRVARLDMLCRPGASAVVAVASPLFTAHPEPAQCRGIMARSMCTLRRRHARDGELEDVAWRMRDYLARHRLRPTRRPQRTSRLCRIDVASRRVAWARGQTIGSARATIAARAVVRRGIARAGARAHRRGADVDRAKDLHRRCGKLCGYVVDTARQAAPLLDSSWIAYPTGMRLIMKINELESNVWRSRGFHGHPWLSRTSVEHLPCAGPMRARHVAGVICGHGATAPSW